MNTENKKLLTAAQVRERFGNISDMSLWRWINDERVAFPRAVYISRRRFWRESEIDAFEARQAAAGVPAPAGSTASTAAA